MSGRAPVDDLEVRIVEDQHSFDGLDSAWRLLDAHPRCPAVPAIRLGRGPGCAHSARRAAAGPHVATLWRRDRLVAVLPLCVRRYKRLRILEWMAAKVSDYCDALIDPGIGAPGGAAAPVAGRTPARRGSTLRV